VCTSAVIKHTESAPEAHQVGTTSHQDVLREGAVATADLHNAQRLPWDGTGVLLQDEGADGGSVGWGEQLAGGDPGHLRSRHKNTGMHMNTSDLLPLLTTVFLMVHWLSESYPCHMRIGVTHRQHAAPATVDL
jgi:hypothetical protein